MLDLHAKAQRAAEWFKRHKHGDCFANEDLDGWSIYSGITLNDGSIRHCVTDGPFSQGELIAFCVDRGWEDDDALEPQEMVVPCADEEEALDCCARGMAQFMDEVDPDPIQLEDGPVYIVETAKPLKSAPDLKGKKVTGIWEGRYQYGGDEEESRSGDSPDGEDGVEWDMKTEAASYGELVLVVERFEDHWDWKVQEIFGDVLYPASGTAPTREEARRQVVEAARRMNDVSD